MRFAAALLLFLVCSTGLLSGEEKNVLVLHSFNQGLLWTDHVNRGIQVYFKDKPVRIFYEYLDSLRYSGEKYDTALRRLLEIKYSDKKLDAVIVCGNSALDFLTADKGRVVPIIACGINKIPSAPRPAGTNIVSITEAVSIRETLEFALKAHSYAHKFHVFVDDSPVGRMLMEEFARDLSDLKSPVKVVKTISRTVDEAVEKIGKVSREDVVFLMGIYPDESKSSTPDEIPIAEVISNCRAPVYSFWDFALGKGIVGGKLINGYDQGYYAADLAWKVLGGESIRRLAAEKKNANRFMFDYHELEKFRISARLLPPGSVIVNKPVPVYERYSDLFLVLMFLMITFLWIMIMYIFQQRKLKNTLQERNAFLQNLIDSIPNPVFYKDLDGRYTGCNHTFEQFVGIAKKEIIGMNAYNLFEREEADGFAKVVQDLVRTRKPVVGESKVRRVDGSVRDLMVFRSLMCQPNKQPFGIVGVAIDMTELKKAEEAINRAKKETELINRELEANRDYLNKIINTISDPVFVKDSDHRWILVNDSFCEFMGYKREELIGKTDRDYFKQDQADIFFRNDDLVLQFMNDNVNEEELTDYRGQVHTIITKKSLYVDPAQRKFIVGIISDITERKKLETELKLMNQDLGERIWEEVNKNREKDMILMKQSRQAAMGEMIRNIAHQWRQPLNALGINIQNVQERFKFGQLDGEYIGKSVKKSIELIQFMSRTIDDFKDFFKPDKEIVKFNVKDALNRAISIVEASMKNSSIGVELHIDKEVAADGYPNEYSQVVLNILSNAKDVLLETKTKDPVIRITLGEEAGKSLLLIWNNGGEIPDEIAHRIFEPYFTTKENGVGIGLYMSKMIIEKNMGGKLVFRNLDGGAEFRITV